MIFNLIKSFFLLESLDCAEERLRYFSIDCFECNTFCSKSVVPWIAVFHSSCAGGVGLLGLVSRSYVFVICIPFSSCWRIFCVCFAHGLRLRELQCECTYSKMKLLTEAEEPLHIYPATTRTHSGVCGLVCTASVTLVNCLMPQPQNLYGCYWITWCHGHTIIVAAAEISEATATESLWLLPNYLMPWPQNHCGCCWITWCYSHRIIMTATELPVLPRNSWWERLWESRIIVY